MTGERIVFRKTTAETDGTLLEMDDYWTAPEHRAPEHVHPEMQESWKIIAGTACFRIAGVERTADAGEVIVAEPGVPTRPGTPPPSPCIFVSRCAPRSIGRRLSSGCSRSGQQRTTASKGHPIRRSCSLCCVSSHVRYSVGSGQDFLPGVHARQVRMLSELGE